VSTLTIVHALRRQHEIKVFFDRETPGLGNRGAQIILQVGQVLDQKRIPRMAPGQHMESDQHVIRGPDAEDPPDDKTLGVDMTFFRVLSKQQAANQKAAQCEEQIDAFAPETLQGIFDDLDQPVAGMNGMKMKAHHHDNGDAAHEIQLDRPAGCYGSRPAEKFHVVLPYYLSPARVPFCIFGGGTRACAPTSRH
jgi:hypothetical protein